MLRLLSFALVVSLASGAVTFSRTVTAIGDGDSFDIEFNGDYCSSEDEYGSNDCTFDWGDTVSGSIAGVLATPLDEGSKFNVNLKVDRVISWKFSCAACGQNCTTTIPVVNQGVNFAMPDCPIPAGAVDQVFSNMLPSEDPLPAKVTATGTVGVTDDSGDAVLTMDISVTAS